MVLIKSFIYKVQEITSICSYNQTKKKEMINPKGNNNNNKRENKDINNQNNELKMGVNQK